MPKIIENLKDRLLTEAQRQIAEDGYETVTIRGIAKGCGVGVGTVYNYFPSKDALIAAYLLGDWQDCLEEMGAEAEASDEPLPVLRCMYDRLSCRHQSIFRCEAAVSGFAGSFSRYHDLLRSQLAAPLGKFCGSDFAAQFMAESLLTWTMAGKPFDEIYEILKKLF